MEDYPKFADITDIRFRYEVMGESPASICSTTKIFMADLLAYIEREGWKCPKEDLADADELYCKGRQYLTRKATKRAVSLVNKFYSIEDSLLSQLEGAVEEIQSIPDQLPDEKIQSIGKASATYAKLREQNALFQEAVTAPAFSDRKPSKEVGDILGDLLALVDGKGRVLPSADTPGRAEPYDG